MIIRLLSRILIQFHIAWQIYLQFNFIYYYTTNSTRLVTLNENFRYLNIPVNNLYFLKGHSFQVQEINGSCSECQRNDFAQRASNYSCLKQSAWNLVKKVSGTCWNMHQNLHQQIVKCFFGRKKFSTPGYLVMNQTESV